MHKVLAERLGGTYPKSFGQFSNLYRAQ
jgi:hypothetical protein